MKYPDQWSVWPTYIHYYYYYIHYYITTLLHYYEFNWYTFTSFPGYMCCMSTPVEYSITSNAHYGLPTIVVNLLVITCLLTNVTTGQSVTAGSVRSVSGPHCPHCQLSLYQADFLVKVVDEEHLHQYSSSEQGQPQVKDRQAGLTGSLTALLLHCGSCIPYVYGGVIMNNLMQA